MSREDEKSEVGESLLSERASSLFRRASEWDNYSWLKYFWSNLWCTGPFQAPTSTHTSIPRFYVSIVILPMTSHCRSFRFPGLRSLRMRDEADGSAAEGSECAFYETLSDFSSAWRFRANDEADDTISVRSKISFLASDWDKSCTTRVSPLNVNFAKAFRDEKQVGEMYSRWSFSFGRSSTSWSSLVAPVFVRV